jgi:hypothetical protein
MIAGENPRIFAAHTHSADKPHTIAKRYKVPECVIEAIDKAAPMHGSLGRALQVATELLVWLPRPLPLTEPLKSRMKARPAMVGKTYKLTPRTIELIQKMTPCYGRRGDVLTAARRY